MSTEVKKTGRLQYIDPTNLTKEKGVDYYVSENKISFPYEDYCIAIDLTIRMTNRYSCGLASENGLQYEFTASTRDNSISFLRGTSIDGSEEGFLTTNFTDVSMTNPGTNTSETLGIESINITYEKNLFPLVTIKFVDIRGATLMQPVEAGYYNQKSLGNSWHVYRGFFTMPYPMFILKVKGFYGKGVTYRLVPTKNDLEFDSETGNFNITSTLTGYMYGIYSDLPLSYLAIAPYIPEGETYWNEKVNDGTFVFKDAFGNPAQKMIKLPELREKIAMASMNLESICEARDDNAKVAEIDSQIEAANQILSLYPFNGEGWFKTVYLGYYVSVYDNIEGEKERIKNYINALNSYDMAFGTQYVKLSNLDKKIEFRHHNGYRYTTFKYTSDTDTLDEVGGIKLLIKGGTFIATGRFDKLTKTDISLYYEHVLLDSIQKNIKNILGEENYTLGNYCIYMYRGSDIAIHEKIINEITNGIKILEKRKEDLEKENKLREDERTEKLIGFRPSVRNIFELIFAHMDTFMHIFYSSMRKIRSQIELKDDVRKKETYSVTGDGDTDTGRFKEDNSTSSSLYNNFLPPFTAFYKDASNASKNGQNKRKESVWPGEVSKKAENLEEAYFVRNLLQGAQTYGNEDYEVEKRIKSIKEGAKGDSSDIMAEGVPSINISNFIPITIADYMYKDEIGNPYLVVKNYMNEEGNENSDISGLIRGIFALRAFHFITSFGDDEIETTNRAFGQIEAINFYKAIGDTKNKKILDFLRRYANNDPQYTDGDNFINILTTTESKEDTIFWGNKKLFTITTRSSITSTVGVNDALIYSLENEKDRSAYLPIVDFDFTRIKQDFIFKESLKENYRYLCTKIPSVDDEVDNDSTKIIKNKDYIDTIYKSIEIELNAQSEENNNIGTRFKGNYANTIKEWLKNGIYKGNNKEGNAAYILNHSYIGNEVVYDYSNNEIKSSEIIRTGNTEDLKKYWIKYASKVQTTDEKLQNILNLGLYRHQTNIIAKAFLFLHSLPLCYNDSYQSLAEGSVDDSGIIRYVKNGPIPRALLLREGSYYWYKDNIDEVVSGGYYKPSSGETYFREGKMSPIVAAESHTEKEIWELTNEYEGWSYPHYCTPSRIKKLTQYFLDWATTEFASYESLLTNKALYDNNNLSDGLSLEKLQSGSLRHVAQNLQNFLRDLFFSVDTVLDVYVPDYRFNEDGILFCTISSMREAFAEFIVGLRNIYGDLVDEANENVQNMQIVIDRNVKNNPFMTLDVRTSTYFTLKSLYDKWLCAPQHGPKTWELSKYNIKSDFNNFIYVDTYYHDIGDLFTINLSKLSEWLSQCLPTSNTNANGNILANNNKSIYEFLHQTAADSGALLLAVPQKIGTYNTSDVKDMFTPFSIHENWDTDSSTFIFMYTYKPSEHLGDADNSFDMNGWSENGDAVDLTDDKIVGSVFSDGGFEVPAFGITYAKQNQSLFKNIRLNNQNAGLSEVAIAGTMNVASTEAEGPRESVLFGQDIYKTLSQYAFKCSAEMMGNMQITPLLYFQLNNIPFWKGGYQILKVNHNITAGNMTTSFEGVRINRHAIPIADNTLFAVSENIGRRDSNGNIVWDNSIGNGVTNVQGNSSINIPDVIDFNENNVSNTTPIISLTPAHGPNTQKSLEWVWSSKVVDKMVEILKEYKYKNGKYYNVQRCNKNGNHTGSGYSVIETRRLVNRFGSDCVIHIAPHWNGGGGSSYLLELDYSWKVREDSKNLANCLKPFVEKLIESKELPSGITNNIIIESMDKINSNVDPKNNDGAPRLDCACVLTENWFADWDYVTGKGDVDTWKRYAGTIENYDSNKEKCKNLFCTKLLEENMIELIAKMHAEGIKKYIDSLS